MSDDVKKIIERVVRDRFDSGTVHILEVKVEEDIDFEGDTIYRVMVVFDNANGVLDPKKTTGLVRHTRSRLTEEDVYKFPIFRFVSQSDAKKIGTAAA